MGGQIILSFCHADQISVPLFLLIRRICQLKLLAMHYNDDAILIQSLEHHRERSVRPSAAFCEAQCRTGCESAPPTLQRSGDSTKCDDNSVSSIFPIFHSFHMILPDFPHLESVPAPRMTAGHGVHICTLMHRDCCKIWKL
jgi:hypothetical protein